MSIDSPSTSGDFRSTMESGTASLTAAATTSKHFLRSNMVDGLEPFDFLFFNSVSSIPLLLYPTANYNVTRQQVDYMNNQKNKYAREEVKRMLSIPLQVD